jgi:hypothetical protein
MPVALISTSTSPACGPCNSTSSIVSGAPAFHATAALVFMMILMKVEIIMTHNNDAALSQKNHEAYSAVAL